MNAAERVYGNLAGLDVQRHFRSDRSGIGNIEELLVLDVPAHEPRAVEPNFDRICDAAPCMPSATGTHACRGVVGDGKLERILVLAFPDGIGWKSKKTKSLVHKVCPLMSRVMRGSLVFAGTSCSCIPHLSYLLTEHTASN